MGIFAVPLVSVLGRAAVSLISRHGLKALMMSKGYVGRAIGGYMSFEAGRQIAKQLGYKEDSEDKNRRKYIRKKLKKKIRRRRSKKIRRRSKYE